MNTKRKLRHVLMLVLVGAALSASAIFLHGCGNGTAPGYTTFFGAGS